MTMRSTQVWFAGLLPSSLAARMKADSVVARLLRPLVNRLLPPGPSVVEVKSGQALGVRLEVYPRSEKYYWLGTYEPQVLQEIATRLRPGANYWDVGSHIGYMVAVASRLVGPTGSVVAFEPNPENIRRLRRTIELNDLQNVTVREVALSDVSGRSTFFLSESSSMGSLVRSTAAAATVEVHTSTVNEELRSLPSPDLIKIDVEGGEMSVLAGASRLFGDRRPAMIVEALTMERRAEVQRCLRGYRTSMLDQRNILASPIIDEGVAG